MAEAREAFRERRKYARIATEQVISYSELGSSDQLGVGRDLSTAGIRFEAVGCEIEQGQVIRVTFNIGTRTVVATGRVAWATELDPLTTDIGLEFVDVDPSAMELIEDMVATEA